jgi:hypothetical protein
LVATSASLALGHVLVFYHRRSDLKTLLEKDAGQNNNVVSAEESLIRHAFRVTDDNRSTTTRQLSCSCIAVLFGTLLVVTLLLGIGITKESFVFEFGGLAGVALGDSKRSSYSLLGLGAALPSSVEFSTGWGIHLLQVAYFFYAVATPFACLLFLSILAVCPMSLECQLQVLTLAEIANAWIAIVLCSKFRHLPLS